MNINRWILPDGVDEVLPRDAWALEGLRRELLDHFRGAGYDLIIPPLVEFADSLLTGLGEDLDLQTFRVVDQLTGRMLGLRSDMSPQAARIDAHSLGEEGVSRLCYAGSILRTLPAGMSGSRAPIQIGLEIFGDRESTADAEVLLLMLDALRIAGVQQFTLDLGHVGINRWVMDKVASQGADTTQAKRLIQEKSLPDLDAWLQASQLDETLRNILRELPRLAGDVLVLNRARTLFKGVAPVLSILDQLQALAEKLQANRPNLDLFLDLGESLGSNYHSGLMFAAYAPGFGAALANGGRYDDVGAAFGRARAATGFSADLKALLGVSRAQSLN